MTFDPNPYASPKESIKLDPLGKTFRKAPALLGSVIGLSIGIIWTFIFGPYTDGPPSIRLSFLMYTTGFTVTGLVVGVFQRMPILIGTITGFVIMCIWAFIASGLDPWVVIWLIALGGSGLFCGSIIGIIFLFLRKICFGNKE